MTRWTILVLSFVIAVDLFLTTVLFLPTRFLNEKYKQQIEGERIISKTRYKDYSKNLDTFYYNLGSLQIPLSAFLLWLWLRKRRWVTPMWLIAIGWLFAVLMALAGSTVWL